MPSGNLGYNPLAGSKDLVSASLKLQNSPEGIEALNNSLNVYSTVQKNEQTRLLAENRNLKLNSIKGLYMQAFDNEDFAGKSAASMFSRIEEAKDKDTINTIYQELDSIREKAEDNKYLFDVFDVAEVGDSFLNWFGRANPFGMDRPESLKKSKDRLLSETNSNVNEVSKWLTPGDLVNNIKGHINEKDYKNFGTNLYKSFKSPEEFNAKLKSALTSTSPQTALDDLINTKLQDNFVTRGNDFYREGNDAAIMQQDALSALKKPDDLSKKYFKFDLENEALGSVKSHVASELTNLLEQPESKENDRLITSYRQSLELIDRRQKDNSKIYGVNNYEEGFRMGSTGRGGVANSVASGVVDLTNLFREDFEGTIYKKALYQPQIASYDSQGRPVMSNQFMYDKADGSIGFNFGAIPEAGGQMIAQMLPTLVTGSLIGGVVGGLAQATRLGAVSRAAASLEKSYENLNKVSALSKNVPLIGGELNIADRLATFLTVSANTLPMMVAEEKKWGGNYFKRGASKAVIEGLTEGIGFPDIGALKFKRFEADLTTATKRAAGVELKFSDNLRNFVNSSKQFAVIGFKQNAVEAFEEELSLLGNAILENTVMPEEFVGREKTQITGEALLDTFVESFAAGAIYSGFTAGFQGIASGNKTHVQNQADWEAANNSELFKAKLKQLNERGSISDQQYAQSVLEVNRKASILKGLFGFENIRDSKTLLEDKDEQFSYYINHLRADELVNVDYDSLTEQERQVFASRKVADKITTKGRSRMDAIRVEINNLDKQDATPETTEKIKQLASEYRTIHRANIKTLNKKELTAEEEKVLKEKGIIGEKDFEFTQQDLDNELSKVSTDILKTQKRIEKYANLSEEDKAKVISDAYDEKINDLDKIEDPNELIQSRLAVQQDLDYLKLKGNYKDKAQIANREKLLDAYGERFDQLVTQIDESGRNSIEQTIENIDYDSIETENDLYRVNKLLNQLNTNRDFINKEMFNDATENLKVTKAKVLLGLMTADPEQRSKALQTFLNQVAPVNATYAYSVDMVNSMFSTNIPNVPSIIFTAEELDAAREAFIDARAARKAVEISDQSIKEDLTAEQIQDNNEFVATFPTAEEVDQPILESGKSVVTDKYNNRYTSKINELKSKFLNDYRQKFLDFLVNSLTAGFGSGSKDLVTVVNLLNDFIQKRITETEFTNKIEELKETINKEIGLRKTNKSSFEGLTRRLNYLNLFKHLTLKLVREELSGVSMPELVIKATTPATNTPPVSTGTVPKRGNVNPQVVEQAADFVETDRKNKVLDSQLEIRLAQLRFLASPLRTVPVEFTKGDIRSTDPVEIRNSNAIDQLANKPYQVRIQSRKGTVKLFLATKFPVLSMEQIDKDFRTIEYVFENTNLTEAQWIALDQDAQDAILQPMHDLLGKEYFDQGALTYFVTNKGDGLTVNTAVVITASTSEGDLVLFDGYPLQANLPKEGRVSDNIKAEYKKAGGLEEELVSQHAETLNMLAKTVSYLSANPDQFIDMDYTTSEGVVFNSVSQKKANELQDENLNNATVQDFAIADSEGQTIFNKRFNFKLGRLYYNNNGNPTVLDNTNISEEEAIAIAELVFSESLPRDFATPDSLEKYLVSLINIVDRNNRVHFSPDKEFLTATDKVVYPLNVKKTTMVDGKSVITKLNKEEFIEFLKGSFYKVDRTMLLSGNPMMRISLVDGKPTVSKQSYAQYIRDTHTFPTSKAGEILSPVNKIMYPDSKQFGERFIDLFPKTQPTTPTLAASPVVTATPTVSDKKADIERRHEEELRKAFPGINLSPQSIDIISERNDKRAVDFIEKYDGIIARHKAELDALEQTTRKTLTPSNETVDELVAMPYLDAINYVKTSQSAQFLGVSSAFVNLYTEDMYNQVLQALKDNPSAVTYKLATRKTVDSATGKTLEVALVDYSPSVEADFVLASITLENGKKLPLPLVRRTQGMGGLKFRERVEFVMVGNSPQNFETMTKEEYLNPALRQPKATPVVPEVLAAPVAPSPKASIMDRLNSDITSTYMDNEEVEEGKKAKEDCINPAKQVKDQIKKKPKL